MLSGSGFFPFLDSESSLDSISLLLIPSSVLFKKIFIHLKEREQMYELAGVGAEGEGDSEFSNILPAECKTQCGTQSQDPEIMI